MFLSIFLLIAGFAILIIGANLLVDGSSSLAKRMSVSEIVIGLTVVAFGTSSPELAASILASAGGQTDIALGNVIGSNIMNIFLILGIAGLVLPLSTHKNTIWKEIPFSLLAVIALAVICNDLILDGTPNILSKSDALILLLFFVIFLVYVFGISKIDAAHKPGIKEFSLFKSSVYLAAGLLGLFFGGKLVIDNSVDIAQKMEISSRIIGLTIIAGGTSLPELFTSVVAAYKKKSDIALGNIVGSNIFNIFFILGVSGVIKPIPFNSNMNMDILVLFIASVFLFVIMFTGKKRSIDRWEAVILVITYIIYTIFILFRG